MTRKRSFYLFCAPAWLHLYYRSNKCIWTYSALYLHTQLLVEIKRNQEQMREMERLTTVIQYRPIVCNSMTIYVKPLLQIDKCEQGDNVGGNFHCAVTAECSAIYAAKQRTS